MSNVIAQFDHNVQKGPLYESLSSLPTTQLVNPPVRLIAYYLPQFHAIDLNDRAWGPGFTEWTNTTKTLPRYVGHYQPRLPAELGFYNLENVGVIERQAELAARGGLYGFCFHYYWFSGCKVLSKPLERLLANPKIDLKFCVNWANENWTRKWDSGNPAIIIKQDYKKGDALRFAEDLVEIMGDKRYIRIEGRPLIMLYRPIVIPDIISAIDTWREVLTRVGLGNPYFIMAQTPSDVRPQNETRKDASTDVLHPGGEDNPRTFGLDAAAGFPPHKFGFLLPDERRRINTFDPDFTGYIHSYDKMATRALDYRPSDFTYFPAVCTDWDNEARRPKQGISFYGSTPKKYGDWLRGACQQAKGASSKDESIVFINAWNEWAEGAYLEPDRHYGYAYLAETRRIIEELQRDQPNNADGLEITAADEPRRPGKFMTRPRQYHQVKNLYFSVTRRLRGKVDGLE